MVDAIQSGREKIVDKRFRYPPSAIARKLGDPSHVPKWMMENLINEVLVTPKATRSRGDYARVVNCGDFNAMVTAFNLLRELEDAHDGVTLQSKSVLEEMQRIGHRQFPWQIGVNNVVNIYRSMHLFGGPRCGAYFEQTYGLSVSDFVLCGFALFALFAGAPVLSPRQALAELNVGEEAFAKTFALLSLPHADARRAASALRSGGGHIAYRQSVLRRWPCIQFPEGVRAPLHQLILARVTSGLYYDVIPARGEIPREIGERFESYCFGQLATAFDGVEVKPEYEYGPKGRLQKTPDLLFKQAGEVRLIGECKAKRMPFAARFGDNPSSNPATQEALDEVAKGIFQIWRFRSHARRGLVDERVADGVQGIVLTLDPWLSMARGRYPDLVRRATLLADGDGEINTADRCGVAFCAVEDFDRVMRTATFQSLLSTVEAAADEENAGWHFAHLHDRVPKTDGPERLYAFESELPKWLPWWTALGDDAVK